MQSRLFHYEIGRSVGGAVFEAVDSATGEPRLLLEWTPPASERESARLRLEAAAAEVHGEVFTADASLYLVVRDRAEAAEALRLLQRRELFAGNWPQVVPPQPVPVQPVVAAPPLAEPAIMSQPLAAPFRQVATTPGQRVATVPPYVPAPAVPAPAPRRSSAGKGCLLAVFGFVLFALVWHLSDQFAVAAVVLVVYSILIPRMLRRWGG